MTEFVGRTGANRAYSYPETRQAGIAPPPLARNYATGTKGAVGVGAGGLTVVWNAIDVGTDPSTDVPITPLSTGEVLISGVITFQNTTGAPINSSITVQIDGPIPVPTFVTTIAAGATVSVPFLAQTGIISPLNEQHVVQVFVTGNGLTVTADNSVIDIQEVPVSTG